MVKSSSIIIIIVLYCSYLSGNSVCSYHSFEIKNKVRFYFHYIFLALVLGFVYMNTHDSPLSWFHPASSLVSSPSKLLSLTTKQVSGNIAIATYGLFPNYFKFCMSYNKYNPRAHAFVCACEESSVCKKFCKCFLKSIASISVSINLFVLSLYMARKYMPAE
jgi:hypothetical protein